MKIKFNWYFGWNIVFAASLLTLLTSGLRMSIGTFFLPMAADLGFTRSELSIVVAGGMLFYGLAMPVSGYLVDRFGTRAILILGSVTIFISAIWTINTTTITGLLLSFGISLSFGTAFVSHITFTQIISKWFIRRRGLALFLMTTGSMAGIAVMIPVFNFLIQSLGWKQTLLGFSIFFMVLTIPVALILIKEIPPKLCDLKTGENKTSSKGQHTPPRIYTLNQILQTQPFWKICVGLFACGFSMNLLGSHGIPMLTDHGFDSNTAAFGIGLIGLVAIFSTIILGRISDTVERKYMLATIYLVRGLGFIGLTIAASKLQLFTVAIIGGLVWAGTTSLSSAITADIYGVKWVGFLSGLTYVGHQIGGMISSWLGGWAYEHYHTHWIAFGAASAFLFIASAVSMTLPNLLIKK